MKQFLKITVVVLLLVFAGCKATAQKFSTHAVKSGETLEAIAKQYKVTQAAILTYNKEIREGQSLKANTILVIPKSSGVTEQKTTNSTVVKQKETVSGQTENGEKPYGFTSYRVKKRETLYGIAKRFNISEDDIKKYNRQLYSSQLKRKMLLKIPKFKNAHNAEGSVNEDDFTMYKVLPKETRWSIANKHGITIDSLLLLNPDLSKSSDYLREGQELKMPIIAGSTVEKQETQLYMSYTVPPKMNFYQLEKKFGVKSDEIVRLNPEIQQRQGLKEGMVIRIPQQKLDAQDINTDNFIFYEVKPKQTEFSLTRKLGISYKDLLLLNPDLEGGLKAGMVLKLPKDQTGDFEVKNALVLDKINLLDSIDRTNTPKLMFLLPFRLDRIDVANKENAQKSLEARVDAKLSLGLYSGALIALDSLASLGISVEVKTFDNQLNLAKTKEILRQQNLSQINAIVGPLDLPSLKEVAIQASRYQVPVIAPIPATSDLSLNNVFFSYTSDDILREDMLNYMDGVVEDQNIIIIADSDHVTERMAILEKFPQAKVAVVKEEEKNIGINIEKLKSLVSEETDNWVFVETDNFKLVSSVTSILNSFQNALLDPTDTNGVKVKMRMFTTNKNKAFDNDVISNSHLSNLHFTYPSVYKEPGNNGFVKRYRQRFGDYPDRYAVRGFDITYDLLLKLAYKSDLMQVSQEIGETEYAGNKFSYKKDNTSGYFNQSTYIMSLDDMLIKEVKM
ncbi:LysM peptidoglycan-binding domain-containing protein [Kriegella aquimaris]|uniref:ABC-type branched-chain amino acid transport system, substrate-binding protein n=1 Tax=Kriegella aquimaris TaxID=192904 RepID=A0A1G9WE90_9FLAO|nr:LysM peptidoglycan-binding domain-containing protein [Kriegella aquimaris]SDM82780.1 ABC-type branched-chain amino acid transport system, substrate-binding protein [Kriegella aquimaris]